MWNRSIAQQELTGPLSALRAALTISTVEAINTVRRSPEDPKMKDYYGKACG